MTRKGFVWVVAALIVFPAIAHSQSAQSVKWYTFEEALKLNEKNPKKILIDVYTDWCSWCKVMDKNTFNHVKIIPFLNEKFYPVKFNAEQKEDVVLGDKTFKFIPQGNRGYHELAAALLNGKLAYPSIVFLDEQVRIIQPFQGYIKPKQFDEISKFIGDDHYKNQSWEDFTKSYVSSIPEE
ncbi:MAG: DUF255 domain-containing protein [Bacteroidales bacterium]|nr:DUF255 domain-containing protein [Bacteroidales bacterium]